MNQELIQKWSEPQAVGPSGFVRLIDYMGDDSAIPQAARVSYGAGTKTVREDADLIRFLMRNEHFSPFAMCQVKLHIRLPIFVHNQFVRHDRFHWNVMSARYSEMPEEKWCPPPTEVRGQGQGNKQVGSGEMSEDEQAGATQVIDLTNQTIQSRYQHLISNGVCREQARTVLPQGQYTEAYVTANLGDWLLFLKARLSLHAQKEIRDFAVVILSIFEDLFPITMEAFKDYQLNGVKMSAQEMETLKAMLSGVLGIKINTSRGNQYTGSTAFTMPNVGETYISATTPAEFPEENRKELLQKFLPTTRERQEFWSKIK